eukprot:GILI01038189.1.p1 GENE.GILI01038189.1~~GILI01038189.1.p1  ORF type:complete len:146 (-),score=14.61 GILI01038189.1:94-531(-)
MEEVKKKKPAPAPPKPFIAQASLKSDGLHIIDPSCLLTIQCPLTGKLLEKRQLAGFEPTRVIFEKERGELGGYEETGELGEATEGDKSEERWFLRRVLFGKDYLACDDIWPLLKYLFLARAKSASFVSSLPAPIFRKIAAVFTME